MATKSTLLTVAIPPSGFSGFEDPKADIVPRVSIRLYGRYGNRAGGPIAYDRLFKIGDEAEYHSYNLHYTGEITGIGPKTVEITEHHWARDEKNPTERVKCYGDKHRLKLAEFNWRNWDFNAEKIAAANLETSYHI